MKRKCCFIYVLVALALMAGVALPSVRTRQRHKSHKTRQVNPSSKRTAQASGATNAAASVSGTGTAGQLAKFAGDGSDIVNSGVTETKAGNVGVGTTTPGSKLTVQGTIETTAGGYKFPDGTIQTSASSGKVFTDRTLQGDGSTVAPLGLAPIRRDSSLTGNGVDKDLGVAVPLFLSGNEGNEALGVLNVQNLTPGETNAIVARGANSSATVGGGEGLFTVGGAASATIDAAAGLVSAGGTAIDGRDGGASGKNGGLGANIFGGDAGNGSGGLGARVAGGEGSGTGHKGGTGLEVVAGPGTNGAADGAAAEFDGNVVITGNVVISGAVSKGSGSFKIDHPLDPENKYLYHSFVESPDMMNIYNGTVTTDAKGEAVVTMPDWFEALNQDFRYQLTVIGVFAQAIVAKKVTGNRFSIKTSAPNVEVSWQVTGIRHDAYANMHRISVEEEKPADERGLFLHPDAFNQPKEKGIEFAQHAREIQSLNPGGGRRAQVAEQR